MAIIVLMVLLVYGTFAQMPSQSTTIKGPGTFNEQEAREFFNAHHTNPLDYAEFLNSRLHDHQNGSHLTGKPNALPPVPQAACTNMDFENGNLTGWTATTGFHPAYNVTGCCPNAGGAQTIVSGAATDPCGGFPVVAPGGSFSLMLGNNQTGGQADRIEQTFTVSAANANFTYQYAVVLQDPGHAAADQPSFQIEMVDANGNQIPCSFYQVSAGQGIPGFQNSPNCANVIFKPWTTVGIDLSNYIGQNVTIRFTTYDCSLGGHYGYAYIDGSCSAFQITQMTTLCSNGTTQLCAPAGFQSYLWNCPGGCPQQNTSCITVSQPGNYSVSMTSVTGCASPVINYNLTSVPAPVASFTSQSNVCSGTVSFTNTSNLNGNTQVNYYWTFGDGDTSTLANPVHQYANAGTFNVSLQVSAANGCSSTFNGVVTLASPPQAQFTASPACAGSPVQFNNQTQIPPGNLAAWYWDFGNGITSTVQHPTQSYAQAGNYNVMLVVTTSNGCKDTAIVPVTIYALPFMAFTNSTVCHGVPTQFNNTSTVNGGSINTYAWDFNSDGIIDNTTANPAYTFATPGNHYVQLMVTTNQGCAGSITNLVTVNFNPNANFTVNNNCFGLPTQITNNSLAPSGAVFTNYTWQFGDGSSSNAVNPNHYYNSDGNYTISLMVVTNQGCTGSFSQPVTIYPAPVAAFTANNACVNQQVQFNNSSSISSGNITAYAWDFNNDGVIDNTTPNPSYVYNAPNNYVPSLRVTSNNNCQNQTSNQLSIYANPVASFSAPGVCYGKATYFTDNSISTNGNITNWNWDFNSDGSWDNISQSPSTIYTAAGNYLVTLMVQTQYGCQHTLKRMVYVNPNPVAQFNVTKTTGCPDDMCIMMMNNSSISSGSITQWLWDFGDKTSPSTSNSPTHCFNTGTFTISLTAVSDSGCVGNYQLNTPIIVYPKPVAGFSLDPSNPDILEALVEIQNQSAGATSWQYFFSDGGYYTHPGNFQHTFDTENPNTYTITQIVNNQYQCKDTAERVVEVKPAFTFYIPNAFTPNADGKNDVFKGQGIGIQEFTMWIFDRWGNLVFESNDPDKGWNGKFRGESEDISLEDVYVWKVKIRDVNHKHHEMNGTVALIR